MADAPLRRRTLFALVGAAAVARPLVGHAQQRPMPVIGFLNARSPGRAASVLAAFRQGFNEGGFLEGQNVSIEYRWGEDRYDRMPSLAAELVGRSVAVLVAGGSGGFAKAATTTIPIVFTTGNDPVRLGLMDNLARPSGNCTGATFYSGALIGKQMELLRELLPEARTLASLVNSKGTAFYPQKKDAEVAARANGFDLRVVEIPGPDAFDSAFGDLSSQHIDALLLTVDPLFDSRADRLVELAARHKIPTVYYLREFVGAGGLLSYGASIADAYRQAGVYTARILKGAKPSDLPVIQPSRFELVINMNTAKTLGLTIPPSLFARADEVIE
jgi:putative ABC transport system substrate-binding protein